MDGLDFLLASEAADETPALLSPCTHMLRGMSHVVILSCHADQPLMQVTTMASAGVETPLKHKHAYFLTAMAHQSRGVRQLNRLETGTARDVSGVVRVSRGGDDESLQETQQRGSEEDSLRDAEWLYHVKGDGSVKVWARGE